MSGEAGRGRIIFEADTRPLFDGLKKFGSEARGSIGSLLGGDILGGVRGLAGAIPGIGLAAGATVGAIGAIGGALLHIGKDYDEVYDNIRAKTGATGAALEGLKGSFKTVFASVPDDMNKVGDVLTAFNTKLGVTGPGLETLSRQMLEAGRIMKFDATAGVDSFSRAISELGVSMKDAPKVLDDIFKVAQKTGVGMGSLLDSLAGAAPKLKAMGMGATEGAALLGQLTKAGLDADAVLSSMQKGLTKLAKDAATGPKEAAKAVHDHAAAVDALKKAQQGLADATEHSSVKAAKDHAQAIDAVRKAQQSLLELQERQASHTTKSVSDQQALAHAQERVAEAQAKVAATGGAGNADAIARAQQRIAEAQGKVASSTDAMTEAQKKAAASGPGFASHLRDIMEKIRTMPDAMAAQTLAVQTFGKAGYQMADAIRTGKLNVDELVQSIANTKDGIIATADKTKDFPELWKEFSHQAQNALEPMASTLLPLVTQALKAAGPTLVGFVKNFAEGVPIFVNALKSAAHILGEVLHVLFDVVMGTIDVGKTLVNVALIPVRMGIEAVTTVVHGLMSGFGGVTGAIRTAIDWVKKLLDPLRAVKDLANSLPFMHHSPPPLATGFLEVASGIARARGEFAALRGAMGGTPTFALAGAGGGGGQPINVVVQNYAGVQVETTPGGRNTVVVAIRSRGAVR